MIFSGVRVPGAAPAALRRESFTTPGGYDRAAHAQALLTSIAVLEERQRRLHPGSNQTGHTDDRPIIGRSDIFHLDKSLAYDTAGARRADWRQNLVRVAEDVVREKFTRRGIPAIFSVHDETNGNGNFHVHVTSFYRQLAADGWAQHKQRPFGKDAWRSYWADGAKILANVQQRYLQRLGIDAAKSPRLSMLPKAAAETSAGARPKGALRQAPIGLAMRPTDRQPAFRQAARIQLTRSRSPPRGASPAPAPRHCAAELTKPTPPPVPRQQSQEASNGLAEATGSPRAPPVFLAAPSLAHPALAPVIAASSLSD